MCENEVAKLAEVIQLMHHGPEGAVDYAKNAACGRNGYCAGCWRVAHYIIENYTKQKKGTMPMPEATQEQLRDEVIHTLHKHGVESGCVPLTEDIMETVIKAWYFGRDTGYREVRDARNG